MTDHAPRLAAPLLRLLAAASLVAIPVHAAAQTPAPPVGIVADPCVGAPVLPASAIAYMRTMVDPSLPKLPLPAADWGAYKAAADKAKTQDWPELCHYRADNARLAALPQADRRIVYLGDSITELWGVADPAFFTQGRVNRGISGQTTAQMVLRFQADVVALHPLVVHIMAGTNDLAGNTGPETMQDFRNNIIAMATLAKANGIQVVLASTPPAAAFPWRAGLKPTPQILEINAWLKEYARSIGGRYVDYYTLLATPEGAMQPGMTFDGVHATLPGYKAIEPASRAATTPLARR